ncbi:hypothetical protein AGABI1DRAFT_52691 [Agaricus bisporus var. burnettii JB137-S8]|uniref:HORMA domain-containing protein n=1 Tax=Agaricus bisporus var. burnettii (strain JB137-S8 / ATCC MYA-4627 / FGSC 10392) TaxID=597362 RepID=K5XGU4_AGABU|nr:uncharacterized protein AGABI1DRAFT_52691 [Agaricus bisporus var. burnettii JB137-S8]EKM82502.1 hypothetical protein AGABI1DRAFT_52691 [Agaricus bisporus var. burnettii JB137-S8]
MMSLQQTRQRQNISQAQSVAVVQTLLQAGLGCITFLRNLLPDDNFSESYFTTSEDSSPSNSQTSENTDSSRKHISGFKIMTMARHSSEEADRLLNYLEHGIFDALGKQYLRSFIFAIYLDNKDPNNIVEAYTFNFRYHKIPECDTVIPIMTLGKDLQHLKAGVLEDPVTEATEKGRVPTLRDVKKSVKTLLKTLIHAMSQMDALPRRRFATFKIFYTDATPLDYEPPYFQSGDAEKDRWYMMTHNLDEAPDKWSIGKVETGHHSVDVNISSITTYLPSAEHQEAAFSGMTDSHSAPKNLTPLQEAAVRAQQIEEQEKDAETRNLVWSTECEVAALDGDADGEDDPDYEQQPDGSFLRIANTDIIPLGVRTESGMIEAIAVPGTIGEAVFGGSMESMPTDLSDLNKQDAGSATTGDETQPFTFHVSNPSSLNIPSSPSTPKPEMVHRSDSSATVLDEDEAHLLAKMTLNDAKEYSSTEHDGMVLDLPSTPYEKDQISDKGLACECNITSEDESCFCEGGCQRWFHIWCMGYHSIEDGRIPANFICFDCRLRCDASWGLIKTNIYPRLMNEFRDLALFRRAIKVAEEMKVITALQFGRQLGMDPAPSRQILKRLEDEGPVRYSCPASVPLGL